MSELPPPPPSMRPRKFNRKIIVGIMAAVVIVTVLVVAFSMMSGNLGGGGAKKTIETEYDAYRVAWTVVMSVDAVTFPPGPGLTVWNNERVDGYFSGYAIVDGSYETYGYWTSYEGRKEVETYNDVKIEFYEYCHDANHADESYIHPHLTGDATISGSQYVSHATSQYPQHSGGYVLTGSMTLSWDYSCSITFAIGIAHLDWAGTITCDGTTWEVSTT